MGCSEFVHYASLFFCKTYKYIMNNVENDYWSDKRPYYILYQDKLFLKDIFAQIFSEFPDVGEIAYIGASSHKLSRDYSVDGEQCSGIDRRKNFKEESLEKNRKSDIRKRARINICESNEESQIREYANIQEIKEMNNMLFYKKLIKNLVCEYVNGKCNNLCVIKDKVLIYDEYKESEDVFVKMKGCCVWLKRQYMDTTALNIANVMGTVNMLGYILEEASDVSPRVIKALAIYT